MIILISAIILLVCVAYGEETGNDILDTSVALLGILSFGVLVGFIIGEIVRHIK